MYIYIYSASWKPQGLVLVSVVDIIQRLFMVSVVGCCIVSVVAGNIVLWFLSLALYGFRRGRKRCLWFPCLQQQAKAEAHRGWDPSRERRLWRERWRRFGSGTRQSCEPTRTSKSKSKTKSNSKSKSNSNSNSDSDSNSNSNSNSKEQGLSLLREAAWLGEFAQPCINVCWCDIIYMITTLW